MKIFSRFLSLLLVIAMLSSLIACDLNPQGGGDTSDSAVDDSTTSAQTDAREIFDLVTDGVPNVKVIRPADLDNTHPSVVAAIAIRNAIVEATGCSNIDIGDDWVRPDQGHDSEALEIIVGYTSYDETAAAIKEISYGDHIVKAVGNKIVVFGYSTTALESATEALISTIKNNVKDGETADTKTVALSAAQIYSKEVENEPLSVLPHYESSEFYSYYDAGDSCHELILSDATPENYAAYIGKLETGGFTKYTDNDMNGNLFTTLYNDKYTLNVGYYKHSDEARIIVEPYSDKTLIGLESENKYQKITTTQITMIGCEFLQGIDESGTRQYAGNGLCLLYRLCDGRFVIIDGGFQVQLIADNLKNEILRQAADYAQSPSDITIAAWIITHPHSDHSGAFATKTQTFEDFNIERVIVNFIAESERLASALKYEWDSVGDGGAWITVVEAVNTLNVDLVIAHVGHRFYFADTVFEVLYTIESHAPALINAVNSTSLVIMATTTDPATGKSTKTMITGDATGPAFAICNAMYGNYMNCDIVQVAHHGAGTAGKANATATAYVFMSPTIVLWPIGLNAFPKHQNAEQNATLSNEKNPEWRETYLAGWNATATTVPLPFTYGVDKVVVNLTSEQ